MALYACMLLMPLTGYVASNFSRHGVNLFNQRVVGKSATPRRQCGLGGQGRDDHWLQQRQPVRPSAERANNVGDPAGAFAAAAAIQERARSVDGRRQRPG